MITQKIIARTDSLKLDKIISRYGEDSMRQVVFIIVRPEPDSEELIPITIPEDAVGSFRILKPSGNFVIVPMNKSVLSTGETAFDVVIPASANTAKGSGYYDIRITSETDKYYFTAQGDFLIDDNIISDEVLEDVSEVNGLIFPDDFLTVEDNVAIIDDDTISTDSTWSSNKINEEIEAHAGGDVSKTVSGNPITFTDGASAPLVKCVTQITGSQDLHGYDKPWVGGAGKNKLPNVLEGPQTTNGITATPNDDGTITINGTATASINIYFNNRFILPQGSYIFSGSNGGSFSTYGLFLNNGSDNLFVYDGEVSFTSDGVTQIYVAIRVVSGVTVNNVKLYPMLRASGTTADFEPYSNICHITAYTEGEIEVVGKNRLPYPYISNNFPVSLFSTTITSYGNGGLHFQGTSSTDYNFVLEGVSSNVWGQETNSVKLFNSDGDYKFINESQNCPLFVYHYRGGSRIAIYQIKTSEIISVLKDDKFEISIGIAHGVALNNDVYPMIVPSSITDYTFEPYTNTTHTTTYPSAIYRGSEDVVNGEVITEWGMIASYAGETLPNEWISDRDEYAPGTTPTTGAQVAYKLAVPTTSSVITTNIPIKSLSGYTHIESTTGDMEVEYITERFQPLIDSIKQL